jgi:Methyltransferase domain
MSGSSHQPASVPRSRTVHTPNALPAAPNRGPLSVLFHDAEHPRASDEEIAWYLARLPRDAGTILEPMSGSGRMLQPLLDAGLSVHGVDVSDAMLASCAARLTSMSRDTQVFRQDVTALNLPFRYCAAIIAGGSFQLLTGRHAAIDALLRIRAHLIEPGLLLLDLWVPEQAEHPPGAPVIEVRHEMLADGTRLACRSERVFDTAKRRIRTQSRYERRAGRRIVAREDETMSMTWYDEEQIAKLLADAGYRDVRIEPPATTGAGARHFAVSARATA